MTMQMLSCEYRFCSTKFVKLSNIIFASWTAKWEIEISLCDLLPEPFGQALPKPSEKEKNTSHFCLSGSYINY